MTLAHFPALDGVLSLLGKPVPGFVGRFLQSCMVEEISAASQWISSASLAPYLQYSQLKVWEIFVSHSLRGNTNLLVKTPNPHIKME